VHPLSLRLLAEDLVRRRRADDHGRYASAQRRAVVDPNPHQIDAVVFALRRLPEGGCILADEVGLGKTIEAGLVVAQVMAEGMSRVLLVVPKPLVGQWQSELGGLFGLDVREVDPSTEPEVDGLWIVGRESAATERGQRWLGARAWDLVVIDEAHELFSGIWRRYGEAGYDDASTEAVTAHRVRSVIGPAPVLLLTATPLQNSLVELWGLVQYVERTGTLLGDLTTFRALFCDADDATLVATQAAELQRRVATVCQRTLRRQAQEFLEVPFVGRRCRLFEYDMSDAERALYDDVSDWLLRPTLHAFAGRQRRLLLLGFHRRMASSLPALARALDGVAERLRRLLRDEPAPTTEADEEELEPDEVAGEGALDPLPGADAGTARAELALVESFAARARALPHDSKARQFLQAIRLVGELGARGQGSGKALVFTESLTTQEYLRDLLVADGLSEEEITLFRGVNDGPRAAEALARWRAEVPLPPGVQPSREVGVRLALVHEFQTRSRVLVCTEAGAKGLNLQFCETVVNYDLPWNPQRIEQRIGRCHRYRQARDVTVVNFLATGNDAHRLTFEILSRKLDLFGRVLDATDAVLHEPTTDQPGAVAADVSLGFVADLARIYDQSRTHGERLAQLAALGDAVGDRRRAAEAERARTAGVLERTFDDRVRRVFRGYQETLAEGLREVDAAVLALVGEVPEGRISLSDPRVLAAVAAARRWTGSPVALVAPPALAGRVGARGVLRVVRASYTGFEPVETLVAAAAVEGPAGTWTPLGGSEAAALARSAAEEAPDHTDPGAGEDALGRSLELALFDDQLEVEETEQRHFERALSQLERFVEDRVTLRRRARLTLERAIDAARARREHAVGAQERGRIDAELARLTEHHAATVAELGELVARRDARYLRWRADYHARRFAPPTVQVLFTAPFHLVAAQGSA
jgi:hypothetical protein